MVGHTSRIKIVQGRESICHDEASGGSGGSGVDRLGAWISIWQSSRKNISVDCLDCLDCLGCLDCLDIKSCVLPRCRLIAFKPYMLDKRRR